MNRPSRPRAPNKAKCKKPIEIETKSLHILQPATDQPTKTYQLLVEVVEDYNARILPDNMPQHPPFQRKDFKGLAYLATPEILQHLIIVTYRTVQFGKSGCDPLNNREVCYHRGQALTELNKLLPRAADDSMGLIFSSAIMALLADFGLSQERAWRYHLKGTRELIQRQGGFTACLKEFPSMRTLLLTFLIMDIFTATVAPAQDLDSTVTRTQTEYIPLLPELERDIVANTDTCPHILLQAIIRTTLLRARSVSDLTTDEDERLRYELADLLRLIIDFDPYKWASQVAEPGMTGPLRAEQCASLRATKAWAHLALCYKSATLLYFVFSFFREHEVEGEIWTRKAYEMLDKHSQILCSMADPDPDAEVETQLWKFLNWPLLVSIHVSVELGYSACNIDLSIDRMRSIAYATGIRSWYDIALRRRSPK